MDAAEDSRWLGDPLLDRELVSRMAGAPMAGRAVCVVGTSGHQVAWFAGVTSLDNGLPINESTWWDLASLTKVLVTLPQVLRLVQEGRLDLWRPLGEQWTEARNRPVGSASPGQLLSHVSGLPPWIPLFELELPAREDYLRVVLESALNWEPGFVAAYSDLGYIILGELVRERRGCDLRELIEGEAGLQFGPVPGPAAATELCPWRRRMICGEVHDENASILGGVAGHAGAFGTLSGVSSLACSWLRREVIHPRLHDEAIRPHSTDGEGGCFGMGWWLPPARGICGSKPGPGSHGMSGFTGNRIWIEPSRGYAVVILSNRVHPRRGDREPFNVWSAGVLDAVAESWQRTH